MRAAKEVPLERLVIGVELKRHGAELIARSRFARRRDSLAGYVAEDESGALPRRLQRGRLKH